MEQQQKKMVKVSVEVRSGTARFRVGVQAPTIRRALSMVGGRYRGGETFVGSVLPDNRPMLGLIGATFAGSRRMFDDGAYLVRMPLRTLEPADPARNLGRAA